MLWYSSDIITDVFVAGDDEAYAVDIRGHLIGGAQGEWEIAATHPQGPVRIAGSFDGAAFKSAGRDQPAALTADTPLAALRRT